MPTPAIYPNNSITVFCFKLKTQPKTHTSVGMVGGVAGYTMVARATHCFPVQRESPVSSSNGVTTGS